MMEWLVSPVTIPMWGAVGWVALMAALAATVWLQKRMLSRSMAQTEECPEMLRKERGR